MSDYKESGGFQMISKTFKKLAVGALMLSTAFAMPAMAGKDFIKKDLRAETTKVAELVGSSLSAENLTFVVHGGNKTLMMAAYRVAQRLDDEGVPIAFLLAPDEDNIDITMSVAFYTKGGYKYSVNTYDNEHITIAETETALYRQARKAYDEDFGTLAGVSNTDAIPDRTLAAR